MPKPTLSDVHVDRPLTNLSLAFIQGQEKYIGTTVFPAVPVAKQSDLYFIYSRSDWNRIEMEKRGLSSESAGGGWDLSTDSYFADVWSLHQDIDDRLKANQDQPIDLQRDATRYVTDQGWKRRDKEWASTFFTTAVWDSDITPATLWDAAGSTPIEDITNEMETVEEATGFLPNVFVAGASVFRTLRNHPDVVDRIKHTQTGIVGADLLASVLDVDKVVVARGVENTAAEGQTETSAYIFSRVDALLVYAAPNPGIMVPSGGYTFSWTGLIGGGAGQRIKTFREERLMSDRIEVDMAFDQKLVASELGVFFNNAVS